VSSPPERTTESGVECVGAVDSSRFLVKQPTATAPLKSPTTIGMRFIAVAA
jgi:hypothetical protein